MGSRSIEGLLRRVRWPFDRLMADLFSNSNTDRANAEQFLRHLSKNHPVLLCLKTSLLLCSQREERRLESAVLLRQFLTPTSEFFLWPRLSYLCQFYIRVILLLSLEEEKIGCVANAKGDTIAQLASNFFPLYLHYPELLNFVLCWMASSEKAPVLAEASLRIFAQIVEPLAHILEERLLTLRPVLAICINHPRSSGVRLTATSAYFSLLRSFPPSEVLNRFQNDLVYTLTRVTKTDVCKRLELLLAEPLFYPLFIDNGFVMSVLAIAKNSQFEEATRHLALEFVITIVEWANDASSIHPKLLKMLLEVLLEMLSDVDDEMPWLEGNEIDQSDNYALALECLDRLLDALGGNMVLKSAEDVLPAYMVDSNCKNRHAALIILAQTSGGCSMIIDLGDVFHNKVLTALGAAMDDFENPCMQVSSVMALQNFIMKCNDEFLIPHLDEIVRRLVNLLKLGKPMMQERAVSVLATVAAADRSRGANLFDDDQFSKYYDAVMPHLMHILRNATNKTYSIDKTHRVLLAKAADCVSLVGYSAGRDKLKKDAQVAMGVLISLLKTLNPEDPATKYILRATMTMCQALNHDFLLYIDTLMKTLLECALLKHDCGIASAESIADVQYTDDMEIKAAIAYCNNLLIFVGILKEHFFPWAEKVALLLAPHIACNCHVEVKRASVKAMPELLKSANLAIEKGTSQNGDAVKQMFAIMLPKFLDAIHKEHDLKTCCVILQSLYQCLKLSARLLEACEVRKILVEIKHLITSSDVADNKEHSYEASIFVYIANCLVIFMHTQKAVFLPFFEELSEYMTPMMEPEKPYWKRTFSLITFVNVIQQCGSEALRYHTACLPAFVLACTDGNAILRRNALRGVGICAEYGDSTFEQFISEALVNINKIIKAQVAPGPADISHDPYPYAVFALGCICKSHKFPTRAEAIATWLNCLPIRRFQLALNMHEQLYSMVESSDGELLGENNKNLTKIISIFAEIISSDEFPATEQLRNQMVNFLKLIEVINPSFYSTITLSHEVRLQLQAILKW